jgi:hypothetical protein
VTRTHRRLSRAKRRQWEKRYGRGLTNHFCDPECTEAGRAARQAYVDSTIGAALALPLLEFATDQTWQQVAAGFGGMD